MDERDFNRYLSLLRELQSIFAARGERNWAELLNQWLEGAKRVRSEGDMQAHLTRTRGAFGGMGSLNDVFISVKGGHAVQSQRDADEANRQIGALRRELYTLIERLLR